MSPMVLEVKNLTKVFEGGFSFKKMSRNEPTVAVDKINLKIKEGEILGLLGPNGAGKTTTIQMLLGTTTKTSGSIRYFGKEFEPNRSEILQQINYATAYTKLPFRMTVWENLMVYAKMYQVDNPKERIKLLLEQFEMTGFEHQPVSALSAGQNTRVVLAKAFINFPKLLLLDEPTASLDPDIADNVRKFLLNQQKKYQVSMLFTSHNMAEVTEVCDRVVFLRKGKIFAEDTPDGLTKTIQNCTLRLMVKDGLKRINQFAKDLKYEAKAKEREIEIVLQEKKVSQFLNQLAKAGITYSEISIDKPTLEDYFLAVAKEEK